jgi:hypothetical protein
MRGQAICLASATVGALLVDGLLAGGPSPRARFLAPLFVTVTVAFVAMPLLLLVLWWRRVRPASSSLPPSVRRWRRIVIGLYGFVVFFAMPVALVHVGIAIVGTGDDDGSPSLAFALLALLALVCGFGCSVAIRMAAKRRVAAHAAEAPPLRLLLLRVFRPGEEYEKRIGRVFRMLARQWTSVGNCLLLGGPDWFGEGVAGAGLSWRRARALVARTPGEVEERIRGFRREPRWQPLAGPYAYPHNSLICADSVWKLAFQTMLEQADVVLMDLRGFSPENRGCVYELGQLMDRVPARRFVLLADESMDRPFLEQALQEARENLAEHSPNRGMNGEGVRVYSMQPRPSILAHMQEPGSAVDRAFGSAETSPSDSAAAQGYRYDRMKQDEDERNVLSMVWEAAAAALQDPPIASPPY